MNIDGSDWPVEDEDDTDFWVTGQPNNVLVDDRGTETHVQLDKGDGGLYDISPLATLNFACYKCCACAFPMKKKME